MARGYDSPFDLPDSLAESRPPWEMYANQLDPFGDRFGQSQSAYPDQLYDYGQTIRQGISYDPMTRGEPFGAPSVEAGANLIDANTDAWLKRTHPDLYSGFGNYGTPTNPGLVASPGGDWAPVDAWDSMVMGAVQKVQKELGVYVPPNLVKSIMKVESGGTAGAISPAGAIGLMQVMPFWGPSLGLNLNDPSQNIEAGIRILANNYNLGDPNDPAKKSWEWAGKRYLGLGGADAMGSTADTYWQRVADNWSFLSNSAGQSSQTGGQAPAAGSKQFSAIWGGFDAPITQGYGYEECTGTDFCFARDSAYAQEAYKYTKGYSRTGELIGHAGVDVGLSYGTALYSPVAGTVTAAGGTGYYCDVDGNGCGPGVGQLNITYPNGDVLILGHMSQITHKVGDAVAPGQLVGYVGSENGAHVHVEFRRLVGKGVTTEGYESVDPRLALQGIFQGSYGQTGRGPVVAASASGSWNDFMMNAAKGLPLTGSVLGTGGFHDYLLGKMPGHAPPLYEPASRAPRWSYDYKAPTTTGPGGQQQ